MLSLTPSIETTDAGLPFVRIELTTDADTHHHVYRIEPGGNRKVLRSADPVTPVSGFAVVEDYEAPFDQTVSYRIVRDSNDDTADSVEVTLTSGGVPWLIHPGKPELRSVPLLVETWPTWTRAAIRGVFQPLGRDLPIAVSQGRGGPSGSMSLFTSSERDRDALLALMSDGATLLLKGTSEEGAGYRWLSCGDLTEEPLANFLPGFVRWSVGVDEVVEPSGFALAAVTYTDVTETFDSYSTLADSVADYAELASGSWLEV